MTENPKSPARGYPVPAPDNVLSTDAIRVIAALNGIDDDVASIIVSLGQKAAASHSHAISEFPGLQAALDGKAAQNHTHNLGALADVDGEALTAAETGAIFGRLTSGGWGPVNLTAADIKSGQFAGERMPAHLSPAAINNLRDAIGAARDEVRDNSIAIAIMLT